MYLFSLLSLTVSTTSLATVRCSLLSVAYRGNVLVISHLRKVEKKCLTMLLAAVTLGGFAYKA